MNRTMLAVLVMMMLVGLYGCGSKPPAAGPASGVLVELIQYSETPIADNYRKSIVDGLTAAGLTEGKDYRLVTRTAEGEMSNIPMLIDAAVTDKADLLVTFQPQILYAALQRAPGMKTVFAILTDPFVLGAGNSDTEHLANVTGQYMQSNYAEMIAAIKACQPTATKLGAIFQIGEGNAAKNIADLTAAAEAQGMTVTTVGYSTSGDIAAAAATLSSKGVNAYLHLPEANMQVTLAALNQAARDQRVPLYSLASVAKPVPCLICAPDVRETAQRFATLLARVIKGENPGTIPFENSRVVKQQLIVNPAACAAAGITPPAELLARATEVIR
ncbi:MAG TPA: ABC transporter substrate-binding protein [bacterium]|nr:ABC transporter substrate-binding protein [bacterium]